MKKRIFICAERKYPKIEAASNRIEYNAKALQYKGYEVIVIGIGENFERDYDNEHQKYLYNGIEYFNIKIPKGGLNQRLHLGKATCEKLKDYRLSSDDSVILYTSNFFYAVQVVNYTFKKIKADVLFDVVEWFQPFQFKFNIFNPSYWLYYLCFNYVYGTTKKVIAISENIENFFQKKGCKTLRLPIITNAEDYNFFPKEKINGVLNLVYPGNPYKKDSLIDMLKAINLLNDDEKKCVTFHITGVSEKKVRSILGEEVSILDNLKENVIIHSWMEYTELIELFSKMNFLLLARPVNKTTLSNFPSKVPELMACGIAPMAVCVGDYYKYLEDGKNAILYEGCRPEDIKDAILRGLRMTNRELNAMSFQARICAETIFDYRVWADRLEGFITDEKYNDE